MSACPGLHQQHLQQQGLTFFDLTLLADLCDAQGPTGQIESLVCHDSCNNVFDKGINESSCVDSASFNLEVSGFVSLALALAALAHPI
jgi:hypothetical protein